MNEEYFKFLSSISLNTLSDAEIGKRLLALILVEHARLNGWDQSNPDFIREVLVHMRDLPDDSVGDDYDFLILPLRLAASGKYEQAGRKFKGYAWKIAAISHMSGIAEYAKTGITVRNGGKKGHEKIYGTKDEKQKRQKAYLSLITELRAESPEKSNRKIYELAEALSKDRFGEKVSYKSFERAEKEPTHHD